MSEVIEQYKRLLPVDEDGMVDIVGLLDEVGTSCFCGSPDCFLDKHHLYFEDSEYAPGLEQAWRDLPLNKLYLPRCVHRFIEDAYERPEKPDHDLMLRDVLEWRAVQQQIRHIHKIGKLRRDVEETCQKLPPEAQELLADLTDNFKDLKKSLERITALPQNFAKVKVAAYNIWLIARVTRGKYFARDQLHQLPVESRRIVEDDGGYPLRLLGGVASRGAWPARRLMKYVANLERAS